MQTACIAAVTRLVRSMQASARLSQVTHNARVYMQLSTCTPAICYAVMMHSLSMHSRHTLSIMVSQSAMPKQAALPHRQLPPVLPSATSLLKINLDSGHTLHGITH